MYLVVLKMNGHDRLTALKIKRYKYTCSDAEDKVM